MTRLTKKAVLDEVLQLRARIKEYHGMTTEDLQNDYYTAFPSAAGHVVNPTREFCTQALLMVATYHMTNVLNLE